MNRDEQIAIAAVACASDLAEWGFLTGDGAVKAVEKRVFKAILEVITLKDDVSQPFLLEDVLSTSTSNVLFEEFWKAYPRKVGKAACERKFKSLKVDRPMLAKMLSAIDSEIKSGQWAPERERFIPHPHTWLNQGRWDDEPFDKKIKTVAKTLPKKPTEEEQLGRALVHAIQNHDYEMASSLKRAATSATMMYANYKLSLEERNILARLGK